MCLSARGCLTPLRAVIHCGLFQTMPLYRSPFILAAGRWRAAGFLTDIKGREGGSGPAAPLYEETQLGPRLYCLQGAGSRAGVKSGRQENVIKIIRIEGRAKEARRYCRFIVRLFQIESKEANQRAGSQGEAEREKERKNGASYCWMESRKAITGHKESQLSRWTVTRLQRRKKIY